MSHMLNRLVDRTFGISPSIEPVRTPVFTDIPKDIHGTGKQENTQYMRFSYHDFVHNPDVMHEQSPDETMRATNPTTERNETNTIPSTPVQPRIAMETDTINMSEKDTNDTDLTKNHEQPINEIVPQPNPVLPRLNEQPTIENKLRNIDLVPVIRDQFQDNSEPHNSTETIQKIDNTVPQSSLFPVESTRKATTPDTIRQNTNSQEVIKQASKSTELLPLASHTPIFIKEKEDYNHISSNHGVSQTTPTIQVTIGRIDVRAVNTPPPAATQKPKKLPKPSLSLEDYLKQRNGGQR